MDTVNLTVKVPVTTDTFYKPATTLIDAGPFRVGDTSKARARAKATASLQNWLDRWERPAVIAFESTTAVLTMLPPTESRPDHVEVHEVFTGTTAEGNRFTWQGSCSYKSWAEAKAHAIYRLADAWVDYFDDATIRTAVAALPEYDENGGHDAAHLLRYVGFQRAHRFATDLLAMGGAIGSDVHTFACENERRFIPTLEVTA